MNDTEHDLNLSQSGDSVDLADGNATRSLSKGFRKRKKISADELEALEGSQVNISGARPRQAIASTNNSSPIVHNEPELDTTVSKVIRIILARVSNDKLLRRKTITENSKGFKYANVFNLVNQQLQRVFAMKLVEGDKPEKLFLVNDLDDREKQILYSLYSDTEDVHSNNQRLPNDNEYFIAKYQRDYLPQDNFELVKTGVLAIVLSLIIVDGNYCNKVTLLAKMRHFGISGDVNNHNSNFNASFDNLLADFERKEYLFRQYMSTDASNGKTDDDAIVYSIGDKAIAEYDPLAFYRIIKEVYGTEFDFLVKSKVKNTLQTAFKMSLADDFGNDSNDNRSDSGLDSPGVKPETPHENPITIPEQVRDTPVTEPNFTEA